MPRAIGKPLMRLGKTSISTTPGDYYGIGFGFCGGLIDYQCCEIGCIITDNTGMEIGDLGFSTRVNQLNAAPVQRMRIKGNGNVVIGNASPEQKLHVNGSIRARDNAAGVGFIDMNTGGSDNNAGY